VDTQAAIFNDLAQPPPDTPDTPDQKVPEALSPSPASDPFEAEAQALLCKNPNRSAESLARSLKQPVDRVRKWLLAKPVREDPDGGDTQALH
jgi:hypothetical protein